MSSDISSDTINKTHTFSSNVDTTSMNKKYNIDKNRHFCNNCGKYGHTFNKCKDPITSLGVIAFRYNIENKKVEFLLIKRKDSLGFVDMIRGKYNIKNMQYIKNIVDEMTIKEKDMIKNNSFINLWKHMWNHRQIGMKYKNEYDNAYKKFMNLKKGIMIGNEYTTIDILLQNSHSRWDQAEWGFPKGRRNYKENDISTSLREFEEETGIHRSKLNIIKNMLPIDEVFTGSNFKSYKCKYFIANIKYEDSLVLKKQDCEVSEIGWFSSDIAETMIRPYNTEKIDIIRNMNNLIYKVRLLN